MNMTLNHVFILVEPEARMADWLFEYGFREGPRNTHPSQGTTNRRFYFTNGMLEFLWVQDADEARNGPGRNLHLSERAADPTASPFGIIFVPCKDRASLDMPFPNWHYQPEYFPPLKGFYVGANSKNVLEPLCFYFPFHDPSVPQPQPEHNSQRITEVVISTPLTDTHGVLALASKCDLLSIQSAREHLMEITLDYHVLGHTQDFRPAMPLILHW